MCRSGYTRSSSLQSIITASTLKEITECHRIEPQRTKRISNQTSHSGQAIVIKSPHWRIKLTLLSEWRKYKHSSAMKCHTKGSIICYTCLISTSLIVILWVSNPWKQTNNYFPSGGRSLDKNITAEYREK